MMFAAFLAAMTVCVAGVMLSYRLETWAPPARPRGAAGPPMAR